MNLKKMILKSAILILGLVTLHRMAIPAQATLQPLRCNVAIACNTSTTAGHCGYGFAEDCRVCYGIDGSEESGSDTGCPTF